MGILGDPAYLEQMPEGHYSTHSTWLLSEENTPSRPLPPPSCLCMTAQVPRETPSGRGNTTQPVLHDPRSHAPSGPAWQAPKGPGKVGRAAGIGGTGHVAMAMARAREGKMQGCTGEREVQQRQKPHRGSVGVLGYGARGGRARPGPGGDGSLEAPKL